MDKLVDRLHDDHAWQHNNVCQNPFFGSDDDSRKKSGPKQDQIFIYLPTYLLPTYIVDNAIVRNIYHNSALKPLV